MCSLVNVVLFGSHIPTLVLAPSIWLHLTRQLVSTGLSVYYSLGELHGRAKLGMLEFESVTRAALQRCVAKGMDAVRDGVGEELVLSGACLIPTQRTFETLLERDANTEGLRAMCQDLQSSHFLVPEFVRHEELARKLSNRMLVEHFLASSPSALVCATPRTIPRGSRCHVGASWRRRSHCC